MRVFLEHLVTSLQRGLVRARVKRIYMWHTSDGAFIRQTPRRVGGQTVYGADLALERDVGHECKRPAEHFCSSEPEPRPNAREYVED